MTSFNDRLRAAMISDAIQVENERLRSTAQQERKPMDKEHQDAIIDAFELSQWEMRRKIRWVIEATERHHGIKETP